MAMIRLLALCLLALRVEFATAQTRLHGPAASKLFAFKSRFTLLASGDTVAKAVRPTHWKLGLVIGGVAGGLALGFAGYGLCHDEQETHQSCFGTAVGSAVLGAAVGGTVGALVGGLFPKHQDADSLATVP